MSVFLLGFKDLGQKIDGLLRGQGGGSSKKFENFFVSIYLVALLMGTRNFLQNQKISNGCWDMVRQSWVVRGDFRQFI